MTQTDTVVRTAPYMRLPLDWRKLREKKCPQCGTAFRHYAVDRVVCECGFSIREKRLKEIVEDMIDQEIDEMLNEEANHFLEKHDLEDR